MVVSNLRPHFPEGLFGQLTFYQFVATDSVHGPRNEFLLFFNVALPKPLSQLLDRHLFKVLPSRTGVKGRQHAPYRGED
jgi:hypothetical protein